MPRGENVTLACSIIWLRLEGRISSPKKYLHLLIFPDDNADVFGAYFLISYCNFSSPISLIVMVIFVFFSKRFFLKRKGLSDAR